MELILTNRIVFEHAMHVFLEAFCCVASSLKIGQMFHGNYLRNWKTSSTFRRANWTMARFYIFILN